MKYQSGRRVQLDLLTHGQLEAVALNTFMGLLAVKRTNGIQRCTKVRLRLKTKRHPKRAITSWKIWPPRRLSGLDSKSHSPRTSHSLCTSRQVRLMPLTTCQKTGLTNMRVSLMKDMMRFGKKSSRSRNRSVLFLQMQFSLPRIQRRRVGRISPKVSSRCLRVKWKSTLVLLNTQTTMLVALSTPLKNFRFSTTPSSTT